MTEPCFEVINLSCSYGKKTVLQDISLSLEPGLFYGLVGPNGSGKTTLINQFLGGAKLSQGSVKFAGRKVSDYPKLELARKIALVPQDFAINFEFSVYEIIMMGRHPYIPRFGLPSKKDEKVVAEVMAAMDIAPLKNRYMTELSGGEKQRVVVARALAQDTEVLILDEATSNLDIHHTIHIFNVIAQRVSKRKDTVIAAIHDLNLACAYCDKIIMIDDGKIAGFGATREVLTEENIASIFKVRGITGPSDFNGAYQITFDYKNENVA